MSGTAVVTDKFREQCQRRITYEENYDQGLNLTVAQKDWNQLSGIIGRHVFKQRKPLEHMAIGFRLLQPGKSLAGFDINKPVVRRDSVIVSIVSPIDACYWSRGNPGRRYRINYQEARVRRQNPGDGSVELWVTHENEEPDYARRLIQKDLMKRPLQDHPRFEFPPEYDPSGILAGVEGANGEQLVDSRLRSPFSGKFELVRNEAHCILLVDNHPVYRMLIEHAESLITHEQDNSLAANGSRVKQGTPLVKMQSWTPYGVLKFLKRGRNRDRFPDMDRIYGDVFCATSRYGGENMRSLHMAVSLLRRLIWAMTDDDALPSPVPITEWAPQHLLEIDASTVWTLPVRERWSVTPDLRADLCRALSPRGDFFLRTEVTGPRHITSISSDRMSITYTDKTVQTLPNQARMLDSISVGMSLAPETPVADWLPRDYHDWSVIAALPYLGLLTQHFLSERGVRPGVDGYSGCGVLLPASYIPSDLQNLMAGAQDYLDFRATTGYFEEGMYVGPPLKQTHWSDFYREANGILYSGQPQGDCLLEKPLEVFSHRK